MKRQLYDRSGATGARLGSEFGVVQSCRARSERGAWTPEAFEELAQAYTDLEAELVSLRRDNEALLAEVSGRRRAQHGSRSERISPEEMLQGLRALKETEPHSVPADMLEELEQECAERARRREARQAQRSAKLARRAEAAARREAAKRNGPPEPPDDGGDDDDDGGGGGGGGGRDSGPVDSPSATAPVINLAARRNACLRGMTPETQVHTVADESKPCQKCGQERPIIGYDDSEMLDIELPRLRRVQHRYENRACPRHPETGVVTAQTAPRPLPQALPTATLLAFVLVSKIADHLPLERLSNMLKRWGTRVAASTLGGWLHAAAELLQPVAEHLGTQVLASEHCLHTDGSHLRVLDPTKPGGSTQAGLWGYTVAGVGTYFRFTPDQGFADTRAQLAGRRGPTMTDGHRAYASQRVPKSKKTTAVIPGTHLHCWAHARRPFEQAYRQDGDQRALPLLRHIQRLYAVEADIRKVTQSPEEIGLLRAARSLPILAGLFDALKSKQAEVTPKSRLGQAISTTLRRRQHLEAYARDGTLPIDNNVQESQFRGKAVGQHNWLFVGTADAARRYATLLTLVRSCTMLGVEPTAYLSEVLLRIHARGSAKDMDALLPAVFAKRSLHAAA